MRVVVAATAEVAIPTLKWLLNSEHDLVRIVTTPDSKSGRGKVLKASPVANWADENSTTILKPSTLSEMNRAFEDCDVVIAIAYGKILTPEILIIPQFGFLNLHFSLLPAYRGAAPVQRAILNGEKVSGFTIFKIDQNLDTGPIYIQEKYEIDARANSADVLMDLSELGAKAFSRVLSDLENGVQPTKQSNEGITLAPKISKDEARINWATSSTNLLNLVRAFTPAPGAWTTLNGENLKITEISSASIQNRLAPGDILVENRRLFVGTSDHPIEISRVVPSGKKEMKTLDWLNGSPIDSGEVFE